MIYIFKRSLVASVERDSKRTRVEKRGLIYLRDYSGLDEVVSEELLKCAWISDIF